MCLFPQKGLGVIYTELLNMFFKHCKAEVLQSKLGVAANTPQPQRRRALLLVGAMEGSPLVPRWEEP